MAVPGWLFIWLFLALLLFGLHRLLRACERANREAGAEWGDRWLNRLDGLSRLFTHRYHRLPEDGYLELPESGPVVLAANHVSGLDPLLLHAASRRPIHFLMAEEHYRWFGLQWLFRAMGCIPVDRGGRPEKAFRAALRALEEGKVVALFPHGTFHLDSEPPRRLKKGVARLAQLSGCPIHSVRIEGVAGEGAIFSSLWRRGRPRLYSGPVLHCEELTTADCLSRLQAWIEQPQD